MPVRLVKREFRGIEAFCRPDTSDERVMTEVIVRRAYRRRSIDFDVEEGEHWLDLGANIGAFALYCHSRGATVECYEPEPSCFAILERNCGGEDWAELHRAAVTASKSKTVAFFQPVAEGAHSRGSIIQVRRMQSAGAVPNVFSGSLRGPYDGVKLDIEGSEHEMLDRWVIPPCRKLVIEYHSSRDRSPANLRRRLKAIRERYPVVTYCGELDRFAKLGKKPYYDRSIWAMSATKKPPTNR